jgi:hypothetical protein
MNRQFRGCIFPPFDLACAKVWDLRRNITKNDVAMTPQRDLFSWKIDSSLPIELSIDMQKQTPTCKRWSDDRYHMKI